MKGAMEQYARHQKGYIDPEEVSLSYQEFVPLFEHMVQLMTETGYKNKHSLPGLGKVVNMAFREMHCLVVSLDYRYWWCDHDNSRFPRIT